MIVKITDAISKLLTLLNKATEVLTYVLTGYAKIEEKKAELEEKTSAYARYIIIGALTLGVALIVVFIIKKIMKCHKKRQAKKIQRAIERQQALEI